MNTITKMNMGLSSNNSKESEMVEFIRYSRQSVDEGDISAVVEVLRSEWLTQGPKIEEFEKAIAACCGVEYAVAVCNGTAALHVACLGLGLGPGDSGLTSPISFLASANCIAYRGATPHFADIDPQTLCLSVEKVDEYFNQGGKAKVVIPVDFGGAPADLPGLYELSQKYEFSLIEDAAHALGSSYSFKNTTYKCGSCVHTDLAILSFHPVKAITTGEGGAVLTNDKELAEKIRCLANHGVTRDASRFKNRQSSIVNRQSPPPWYYEMQELGFNYRITDIQCALGLSQIRKLDGFVKRRREIAAQYDEAFTGMAHLRIPAKTHGTFSSYHLYPVQVDFEAVGKTRSQIMRNLKEVNIGTQVHYIPIHIQPFYQQTYGCRVGDFPISEAYYREALSLPIHPEMTDSCVQRVIDAFTQALMSQ